MQITVERTGGFTGIPLTKTVDSATLSQQEAIHLHQMMAAADFFKLPSTIPSIPQPDRFQYQITVEQEGKLHSVTVGEAAVPANLKTILKWLMEQSTQTNP
ncbi:MAG: protealysin inhibitor emfourin [Methylococcaceae bacterium]